MPTRRDMLRLAPAPLAHAGRPGRRGVGLRADRHPHPHPPRRPGTSPPASRTSNWRGLDIVVCPAAGDEPFDLEEKLGSTLKVARDSGGTLAWASTFDARGFEDPGFADRTIAAAPPVLRRRGDRREDLEEHRHGDQGEVGRLPPAGRPAPCCRSTRRSGRPTGRSSPTSPSRTGPGCRSTTRTRSCRTTRRTRSGTCTASRGAGQGRDPGGPRPGARPLPRSCAWSGATSGATRTT